MVTEPAGEFSIVSQSLSATRRCLAIALGIAGVGSHKGQKYGEKAEGVHRDQVLTEMLVDGLRWRLFVLIRLDRKLAKRRG